MFSLFQDDFVDDVVQFCTSVCSVARVYIYYVKIVYIIIKLQNAEKQSPLISDSEPFLLQRLRSSPYLVAQLAPWVLRWTLDQQPWNRKPLPQILCCLMTRWMKILRGLCMARIRQWQTAGSRFHPNAKRPRRTANVVIEERWTWQFVNVC